MRNDIQPKYEAVTVVCNGCGAVIETRSTKEDLKVDICSNCHPFFTGQQKFINRGGRVEKFKNKYNLD